MNILDTTVTLIAAVSDNNVIGVKNALPWTIPEDMAWFRMHTYGGACIMGRKTWESLPKRPLKGRLNIVLSTKPRSNSDDVIWTTSLAEALAIGKQNAGSVYIIGGSDVFHQALLLDTVDQMVITHVHTTICSEEMTDLILPKRRQEIWSSAIKTYKKWSYRYKIYKI